MRYLIGMEHKYSSKIEEAMKAHVNIRLYDVPVHTRKPVGTVRRIKITSPTLSLNTEITMSVTRAGLAAMAAGREDEETVLQLVLEGAYAPSSLPAKMSDPSASWLDYILGNVSPASAESRTSAKKKAEQHVFQAVVRPSVPGEALSMLIIKLPFA